MILFIFLALASILAVFFWSWYFLKVNLKTSEPSSWENPPKNEASEQIKKYIEEFPAGKVQLEYMNMSTAAMPLYNAPTIINEVKITNEINTSEMGNSPKSTKRVSTSKKVQTKIPTSKKKI